MSTFSAFVKVFPLQKSKIFFTIFIGFEALSKLYEILTFKYFDRFTFFWYFKDMNLSCELKKLNTENQELENNNLKNGNTIVLITGANRSIGLETAKQLAQKGFFVYLGSRDLAKGEAIVKELGEQGLKNIKAIEIDVTKPESISSARNIIEKEQGKLDILINNAGIPGTLPQTAAETSVDNIREVFETNFFGVINVTQAFLELLKKSDKPRISNITSGLGSLTLHSDPTWKYYQVKHAAYGPSKSALNAYTIVLAYELKDSNFKVNVIDPGYTATDFNGHRGPGSVESAASLIIKHTVTDDDAPTGQFYSNDIDDEIGISPW